MIKKLIALFALMVLGEMLWLGFDIVRYYLSMRYAEPIKAGIRGYLLNEGSKNAPMQEFAVEGVLQRRREGKDWIAPPAPVKSIEEVKTLSVRTALVPIAEDLFNKAIQPEIDSWTLRQVHDQMKALDEPQEYLPAGTRYTRKSRAIKAPTGMFGVLIRAEDGKQGIVASSESGK